MHKICTAIVASTIFLSPAFAHNYQRHDDVLAMMLTRFMQVTHLALIELIKSRGGIGPWSYEFKAKVVPELKNRIGDGGGMADEIDFTEATIHLTNTVVDGVRKDL
jgi:hypothetical protein